MKRLKSLKQYVSLLIIFLSIPTLAVTTKKPLGINDYLEISCEVFIKKETNDLFLKQLKNKLTKIHRASGSESSLDNICQDLGEAQFSRLMEDEYLLFEKK